jgi:uroporphyrin-III C-methyltransferase/precorrin-2 dehydrogenase/sirohydrochlorin ferrochelatase
VRYFPTFVDLAGAAVLVVGGGAKCLPKLRLLAKTPVHITAVAERFSAAVRNLAEQHGITLIEAAFAPEHLDGVRLVFAASADRRLDARVAAAARQRAIPVNVVDRPQASTFIVPALVDRDPVVVAVGSEGAAPVLARNIRSAIERLLPGRIGVLARQAAGLRARIGRELPRNARRRFWEQLFAGPWRTAVLTGDDAAATSHFGATLACAKDDASGAHPGVRVGQVSLVGAGPGDPDLLTLRAQRRLEEADVIVVDGLVGDRVLDHARRDAIRIRAGKEGYGTTTEQSEINRILVREARGGRNVVRLKGGDPLVFGRAAEEMAALQRAGIPVDIVPGVTAAHAAAASIGLPLTLRDKVRQFSVVTGTTGAGLPDLDWRALAAPGQAFAVYMGVRNALALSARLLAEGAAPGTTVLVVENATRPNERVVETTLAELAHALRAHGISQPAVILVGLDWDDAGLRRPARVERYRAGADAALRRATRTAGETLTAAIG